MIKIFKIFMFVLCIVSIMITSLGLYLENMTIQAPKCQQDHISVEYTRRGQFINVNEIKERQKREPDNDTTVGIELNGNNKTQTVQQPSKGQQDQLSVGYTRRGTLKNTNGINEHEGNATNNERNSSKANNTSTALTKNNSLLLDKQINKQTTVNTSSIFLDYQQVLKNSNFSMNRTVNISELRPDRCDACFPQSSYIYKNDNLCSTNNSTNNSTTQVKLLVIIFTLHHETETRDMLRKTWTSISIGNTRELRYVFLLGKHMDPKWNVRTVAEAIIYGDILMNDFMDEYENLTLKTMSGLKWATEFCSNAEYVMKTDTDMWVNTPRLLKFIDSFKIENEIIGKCPGYLKPQRKVLSKYYVSPEQYPHLLFPHFCSGTGYVTTMKVAKDIVEVSPNIPFFFLEDVYVALCNEALGYKVRSVKGFNTKRMNLNVCGYKHIFTSHHIIKGEIEKVWNINYEDKTFQQKYDPFPKKENQTDLQMGDPFPH
ncbi:unnamed protein product [Owenia fusiformis]|uniref:Hexosyltransferase n=1 Tax=Owenia fusiformis TaxID=6347 RepID=A0A8J1TBF7_OWEFU|nr:unnamed protein product [Owenia fusiformis]